MNYLIKRFSTQDIPSPDIWQGYIMKIEPMIKEVENKVQGRVFFCHALKKPEFHDGYWIIFDTVPGIMWREDKWYLEKTGFWGGKSIKEAKREEVLKYLGDRFCTLTSLNISGIQRTLDKIHNAILKL